MVGLLVEIALWILVGAAFVLVHRRYAVWEGPSWRVAALGVTGALVGGLVCRFAAVQDIALSSVDTMSCFGAVIGALAFLAPSPNRAHASPSAPTSA